MNQTIQTTNQASPQIQFEEDNLHDIISNHAKSLLTEGTSVFVVSTFKHGRNFLFDTYLNALPQDEKQRYNCACCRTFIRKFGNLAIIDKETGLKKSLLWNEEIVGEKFKTAFSFMRNLVEDDSIEIDQVFQYHATIYGSKELGGFAHMAMTLDKPISKLTQSNSREDFKTFKFALECMNPVTVTKAFELFKFYHKLANRKEFMARLEKFQAIQQTYICTKDTRVKNNLIWMAVANNTPDIIFFQNTVLGKFVINLEKDVEPAIGKFLAMTKADKYLRPTEPPKQGTVQQAEKIVSELNLARSFERRTTCLDDFKDFIWKPETPKDESPPKEGFFAGMTTKENKDTKIEKETINAGAMTWVKFQKDYLPTALNIYLVPSNQVVHNWCGILTAVHPDAPPILRWDNPEARNTLSTFGFVEGSHASDWVLFPGLFKELFKICGIIYPPASAYPMLLVEGAKLKKYQQLALFPEILRPELTSVRSVIEEYSKTHSSVIHPNTVSGFAVQQEGFSMIIETENSKVNIDIDRFE